MSRPNSDEFDDAQCLVGHWHPKSCLEALRSSAGPPEIVLKKLICHREGMYLRSGLEAEAGDKLEEERQARMIDILESASGLDLDGGA